MTRCPPLSLRNAAMLPLLCLGLAGCAATNHAGQNPGIVPPAVQQLTPVNRELRALPAPAERIGVAVYDFEDLTGQFKERDNVQSLSRAVSQGASAMLIQSLHQAGDRRWFTVLERDGLDDLLRERQIVTEMRRIYQNDTTTSADELPPLILAPVIISGGVIGFDTNNVTGGVGARFLGIGGDVRYQQDTVTLALRATSVKTGEVLASVTANKAIASYRVQGNVFRFVALDELLELETGVSGNEPSQIALQQAVDKAVYALIVEGAMVGAWDFADPAVKPAIVADYLNRNFDGQDRVILARKGGGLETVAPTRLPQIGTASLPAPARKPPAFDPAEPPLG